MSALPSQKQFGYVPELNGLRGVAILVVMIYHAKFPFLRGGFIGVDIFFVLSGFLISVLLVQEFNRFQSISLKNFYIRRLLRLGPALVAFLLLFCLWSLILLDWEAVRQHGTEALIALAYMSNWVRAYETYPLEALGHTWSLSIEEQFYLLWPVGLILLLRVFKRRSLVAWAAVGVALGSWLLRVCLLLAGTKPERLYNGLDTRADALMIGCALGIVIASGLIAEPAKPLLAKVLTVLTPVSVVCLLVAAVAARWRHPGLYYYGFIVIELATAVLILDIFFNPRSLIRRFLTLRWLVWVGAISYGLYLWHYPIFYGLDRLGYPSWVVFVFGSLFAFFVAASSFSNLEAPLLKFKKRFASGGAPTQVQSATVVGTETKAACDV